MKDKARYWSPSEIKILPKDKRDAYFGADTSDWKFTESGLSDSEIKALKPLLKSRKFKSIYRIPVSRVSQIH